ncbi:MAG: DUF5320 domain-containing protein [Sphaerochaeta sp.]|nr:DUF5320 domain-containing protein [Sphaerochaeta sp.]
MPRGDGTGRNGGGPMTGRGMGYCAGFDMPGYMNGRTRFLGRGRGFGRGFGYGNQAQADALALHAQRLEEELAAVKNRMATLAKESVAKGDEA